MQIIDIIAPFIYEIAFTPHNKDGKQYNIAMQIIESHFL